MWLLRLLRLIEQSWLQRNPIERNLEFTPFYQLYRCLDEQIKLNKLLQDPYFWLGPKRATSWHVPIASG